ncbi:unnamed protein product, partial [Porites lobata]
LSEVDHLLPNYSEDSKRFEEIHSPEFSEPEKVILIREHIDYLRSLHNSQANTEMKIAGVLLIISLALCAMECSVSAFRLKEKDFPRKIQNDGSFSYDPCGDVWTKFEEYCYHVSGTKLTEKQAEQYCDQKMDANLAKINSQEENNFVLDLAHRHAPSAERVWIGLKWESRPKDFYWYDHSFPTFKNWAPGEPNGKAKEPCVLMYVGKYNQLPQWAAGYWNDINCEEKIAAVCKRLY